MSDVFRRQDGLGKDCHAWQFTDVDAPKPGWLVQAVADGAACLRFGIPAEPPRIEFYVTRDSNISNGAPYTVATLTDWIVVHEGGAVTVHDAESFGRNFVAVEAGHQND